MILYGLMKYNRNKNAWEMIRQYKTWIETRMEITEEEVIAIKSNSINLEKKIVPFKYIHEWTKVLNKKDLSKIYFTKEGNIYKVKTFEIY